MRRIIGHYETRPGLRPEDPPVEFPVARDLETVPGVPTRPDEVTYYSREEPLESVAVDESASVEWANEVRKESWPEVADLYERHVENTAPLVEWVKLVGDLDGLAQRAVAVGVQLIISGVDGDGGRDALDGSRRAHEQSH